MTDKSEIDELKRELAAVKRQLSPTMPSEKEIAASKDAAHQARERSAAAFNPFTPDQLRAMHEASPNTQAIVHDQRGAPQGPTSIIPSTADKVRGSVGRGTVGGGSGWAHHVALKNGLGQGK
jgi:hypothetical protein